MYNFTEIHVDIETDYYYLYLDSLKNILNIINGSNFEIYVAVGD